MNTNSIKLADNNEVNTQQVFGIIIFMVSPRVETKIRQIFFFRVENVFSFLLLQREPNKLVVHH